jgi:phage tail sheath protein FI
MSPPLPTSIAAVKTAIPAFIGYTEKQMKEGFSLNNKPTLISSLIEYEAIFGYSKSSQIHIHLHDDNSVNGEIVVSHPTFHLHYALQLYFANGGNFCYIISAGTFQSAGASPDARLVQMQQAVAAAGEVDEITLFVFPDAPLLIIHSLTNSTNVNDLNEKTNLYYKLFKDSLALCERLRDRFAILDVWQAFNSMPSDTAKYIMAFRESIGTDHLSYGAAYYPWLRTTITFYINEKEGDALNIAGGTGVPKRLVLRKENSSPNLTNSLFHINRSLYDEVQKAISKNTVVLPPSAAVAGIYTTVDNAQGVWKAPANIPLKLVKEQMVFISDAEQQQMNIDVTNGKSINAIRTFPGKGVLVWGARTLAGNDNDWRYVSVRRFCIMVEESIKKLTEPFIFQPNDANTWAKVKLLSENFLSRQWRAGALPGATPRQAFYVTCGLGQTMTIDDITEGRLIIEIGLAVVRPAEFVIIRIGHWMKRD